MIGGYNAGDIYTTEVFSFKDNVWTEADKLPTKLDDFRAATVNNRVLLFGNLGLSFITFGYFLFPRWI